MFWYDHGPGGWGWFAMSAGMILFWAVIVAFGVLLFRALSRPGTPGPRTDAPPPVPGPGHTPEQLLAERFARGEIDEDEYHRRLTVLRAHAGEGPRLGKS